MNIETFETICEHLESGQPVKVRTTNGGKLHGKFLSYDHSGLNASLLIGTSDGQTLCLNVTQIDRIFPCDDDDTHDDTFPPNHLDLAKKKVE
jgi:hypothetical protein